MSLIDPKSPVPLPAQIADLLARRIAWGEIDPGAPPAVTTLARELLVSPAAVREAYRILEQRRTPS